MTKSGAKNTAKNAAVFSGRNGLDFYELRTGVLRIPEVSLRIREAQAILDTTDLPKVDLFNVISSDDNHFFRNVKLKSLVSAIVQVGLFDRFLKTQRQPDFLLGNSNGDAAMMVCAGLLSFRELIENSAALESLNSSEKVISLVVEATPLLSGITLMEYCALRLTTDEQGQTRYEICQHDLMDLKKIISSLAAEESVVRFINVGPVSALRGSDYKALGSDEVESLDSIELDPMLGWFWHNLRQQYSALAQ